MMALMQRHIDLDGLDTIRAAHLLAEYLAPLWPEQYRDVAVQRRELRGSASAMC
jgi:hypothetical protein